MLAKKRLETLNKLNKISLKELNLCISKDDD